MNNCQICKLKNKQIRRTVKNLILLIQNTIPQKVRSFKDHTQQDPLSKLLNNFLKGQIINSQTTEKCKHHLGLKLKILQYLSISQGQVMKRCQYILMSQIKTNYTLDTLSLKLRCFPFKIPFIIMTSNQTSNSINQSKSIEIPQNDVQKSNQMVEMGAKRRKLNEQSPIKMQKCEGQDIKIEITQIQQQIQYKNEVNREGLR